MWTLHDLAKHRALGLLAEMADAHPTPFNMGDFTRASRFIPERAKPLRDAMQEAGLIQAHSLGERGPVRLISIHLTDKGLQIGLLAQQMRTILREN